VKGRHKHAEASLKSFDNHRWLSRSEQSKWYIYSFLAEKDISVEKFQWSFRVFLCVPSFRKTIRFFGKSFLFIFMFLCCNNFLSNKTVGPKYYIVSTGHLSTLWFCVGVCCNLSTVDPYQCCLLTSSPRAINAVPSHVNS
jgi:hypothetical protein